MNLQAQYARGLLAYGYIELTPSSRYRVFFKAGSSAAWVWIGPHGAARYNSIKRVDGSIPFSDISKRAILQKGAAK